MDDKIHFKITHGGVTRRFALSRAEENLFSVLKKRVLEITTAEDESLYWKDEDTLLVLETEEDLGAAIEFAQTQNKLACVSLVTEPENKEHEKKEKKEKQKKVVTEEESKAAYSGFSFSCADCKEFLAPSNGGRFRCLVCDDVDFCAACFDKNKMDGAHPDHAFLFFRSGDTQMPAFKRTFYAKDAHKCTPAFKLRTVEWQKQKKEDDYVEAESKKGRHFDEIYMYGEPFPLLRPDTPVDHISEDSSREVSPVRAKPKPRRESDRAPNREKASDWECHVTDQGEIRARSDSNGDRGRVGDRDARETRERPQFEFYSSRYGGTQAILEQGGWRADRENRENGQDRNRDGSYGRREQERFGTGGGRNGWSDFKPSRGQYSRYGDDDQYRETERRGFENNGSTKRGFGRWSEERNGGRRDDFSSQFGGRDRQERDRHDNDRGFNSRRDEDRNGRSERFGNNQDSTDNRGFVSNRERNNATFSRGFGGERNENVFGGLDRHSNPSRDSESDRERGNFWSGRFGDNRERKDTTPSHGYGKGRDVDYFGGPDRPRDHSRGFENNRRGTTPPRGNFGGERFGGDRDFGRRRDEAGFGNAYRRSTGFENNTNLRGNFGSGRFGDNRERGGTQTRGFESNREGGFGRNENRFGVPPRRKNFPHGFDSNRENIGNGWSFGGNWGEKPHYAHPNREEQKKKEAEEKKADHEAYKKAAQIPAHMMSAIIEELMTMSVEEMQFKLTQYTGHLHNNRFDNDLNPDEPIFPGADDDERLVGNIATDLIKHIESIELAIQKLMQNDRHKSQDRGTPRKVIELLEERLRFLQSARVEGDEYTKIAKMLRPILIFPRTTPGGSSSSGWDTCYPGFMKDDPQAKYKHPLEFVASANPTVEGKYAPHP